MTQAKKERLKQLRAKKESLKRLGTKRTTPPPVANSMILSLVAKAMKCSQMATSTAGVAGATSNAKAGPAMNVPLVARWMP